MANNVNVIEEGYDAFDCKVDSRTVNPYRRQMWELWRKSELWEDGWIVARNEHEKLKKEILSMEKETIKDANI